MGTVQVEDITDVMPWNKINEYERIKECRRSIEQSVADYVEERGLRILGILKPLEDHGRQRDAIWHGEFVTALEMKLEADILEFFKVDSRMRRFNCYLAQMLKHTEGISTFMVVDEGRILEFLGLTAATNVHDFVSGLSLEKALRGALLVSGHFDAETVQLFRE